MKIVFMACKDDSVVGILDAPWFVDLGPGGHIDVPEICRDLEKKYSDRLTIFANLGGKTIADANGWIHPLCFTTSATPKKEN